MKPFWVYILECSDGSYYIGHTDDLEQRIEQHNMGQIKGYTSSRLPIKLLWSDEASTRDEALAFERQIKKWSRAKKEALMKGDWERIKELARSRKGRTMSG